MFTYVLEPQNFVITKFFVAGCDDFVAWLEAFDDLVELWVLTTDTNLAFYKVNQNYRTIKLNSIFAIINSLPSKYEAGKEKDDNEIAPLSSLVAN